MALKRIDLTAHTRLDDHFNWLLCAVATSEQITEIVQLNLTGVTVALKIGDVELDLGAKLDELQKRVNEAMQRSAKEQFQTLLQNLDGIEDTLGGMLEDLQALWRGAAGRVRKDK